MRREDPAWRKRVKEQCPSRGQLTGNFAHEQEEIRQRGGEEDHGLDASDPLMNAGKFVTNGGEKRQNRKFRSDITGRIARPINLRISEMKTVFIIISRDGRDVALPPAPIVDIRLIDCDQADGDSHDTDGNRQMFTSIVYSRKLSELGATHDSRLDKAAWQSQSSTVIAIQNEFA